MDPYGDGGGDCCRCEVDARGSDQPRDWRVGTRVFGPGTEATNAGTPLPRSKSALGVASDPGELCPRSSLLLVSGGGVDVTGL